ncbi:GPP34 family phosphoprotein [Nocardioides sp. MAH-18]|uniref:GPP34 family phosphoprotein n=1 Tax=Nocardioides agri TaxID=2682843 RepID=A0A6L6XXI0_9ACTN|nr:MULTISPECIES: GPP34 family phosphoprotein [unclassified Nocardioides]MBA2956303.1 GPP34 family phosphoprotein [Nocardioides sp. CGMCC 1.13656]MVQ51146.1 GPP34 family phosphoprotein [Nocardioides sp. MAH-18]
MATLIAEDLLLLLLDDEKGTIQTAYPQTALGGGVLIELALTGAVEVEERSRVWRSTKVRPVAGQEPEDPVLRTAYDLVAEKERGAQDLVERIGKGLQKQLPERLAERGLVERRDGGVLGLFPRTRWPAADTTHEQAVRRALTAALVQGAVPDERTAALIALLSAIDKAHKVVDHEGLSAREVKKRAKEISEGAWAAKAVRDAINASVAAIAAATTAATVAASSGST